jgi:hypothetical protein
MRAVWTRPACSTSRTRTSFPAVAFAGVAQDDGRSRVQVEDVGHLWRGVGARAGEAVDRDEERDAPVLEVVDGGEAVLEPPRVGEDDGAQGSLPALRAAVGPAGKVVGVPAGDLRELARVVRPGGLLALFHPVGRAALAARHGRRLTGDDLRAEENLRPLLAGSGWRLQSYVDEDSGFLALAERTA